MQSINEHSIAQVDRKPRESFVLKKIYKLIGRLVLILIDGSTPQYMTLYLKYIKRLGVNVSGSPKYIASDLKIDSADYSVITIGDGVVISSEVRFLTHDYSVTKAFQTSIPNLRRDIRKICSITIEDHAFIGMRSTILPGVQIGHNAIVGACSVVTKSVDANTVVAGNPARVVCSLDEYQKKVLADYCINRECYFEE
jgi:acetyltransferase-like isoleucine patch superfamily enzyme